MSYHAVKECYHVSGLKQWKQDLPRGGVLTRIIWFWVLGVILTFFPHRSANIICYIGGGLLILYGIVKITTYFRTNVALAGHLFSTGLIALAGGLVVVLMPEVLAAVIPLLIGFALIACSMLQLEMALGLSRMKYPRWYLTLAGAVLMLVLGVVILVNPFSTSLLLLRFIGISMLIEAVCDLVGGVLFSRAQRTYGE